MERPREDASWPNAGVPPPRAVAGVVAPEPPPPGADAPLRCLLVGAGPGVRSSVERWVEEGGGAVLASAGRNPPPAPPSGDPWDLVVAVVEDGSGADLSWVSEMVRAERRPFQVLLAAARPSLELALRAASLDRTELVPLPPRRDDLLRALERARSVRRNGVVVLRAGAGAGTDLRMLIGESPAMLEVYKTVAAVAPTAATVLIQGKSGTGKELVARAIHGNGPRRCGPFVAVNCAAIPEGLLESDLFGHEKGAFTGAAGRTVGRFQQAEGGTILLDEIADMGRPLQAKILRVLEERVIERVGNGAPIPVDVRVIAATNRDLRDAIGQGRFREDLYHRLAVVTIRLPPLRERGGDLDLLALHFARQFADQHRREIEGMSKEALSALRRHPWPGNVRELRNVLERAVIVSRGGTLRPEDLPEELRRGAANAGGLPGPGPLTLEEAEARRIAEVLSQTRGRIGPAAEILGIHRNTLARKMHRYGL